MSTPSFTAGVRFRRDADGQGVLLIPEGLVNLNDSAAAIIELVDGERTAAQIARDLSARYASGEDEIAADIEALLKRLAARGWLTLRVTEKS